MADADPHRAIEAIWRIESAKVIAGLARIVRDVGLAEDLAQDVLVAALERWPESGVPENPGAWLMATAKNRAMDGLRRGKRLEKKHEEIGLLRLVFISSHPVLSSEARVALTLRLLGGLTEGEIARAFLVPEPTVAQRIVRAKRTLAEARVPFEVPRGAERAARLAELSLASYHLLPSVRGDLLEKVGRRAEARAEFERAASLTRNARERTLLLERAAAAAAAKS